MKSAVTIAKTEQKLQKRPPQHQSVKPGLEKLMVPQPLYDDPDYRAAGKLQDKVAIITGGDSGIGRAISIIYAKEGADVVIVYLNEHEDAEETVRWVESKGRQCLSLAGDIGDAGFCKKVVEQTLQTFGKLDIVVNNVGEVCESESIEALDPAILAHTFRTNVFSMFYLVKEALPHLKEGSAIINTASIAAYRGYGYLLNYSSSKAAVVAFTRSLAEQVVERGIRVNGVAPGPIWTPLIPASFPEKYVEEFGSDTPMKRAGQPSEVAPCYVFLAAKDSSYISGQILHPNGGSLMST